MRARALGARRTREIRAAAIGTILALSSYWSLGWGLPRVGRVKACRVAYLRKAAVGIRISCGPYSGEIEMKTGSILIALATLSSVAALDSAHATTNIFTGIGYETTSTIAGSATPANFASVPTSNQT